MIAIVASALVLSFVGLLLADSQVEQLNVGARWRKVISRWKVAGPSLLSPISLLHLLFPYFGPRLVQNSNPGRFKTIMQGDPSFQQDFAIS